MIVIALCALVLADASASHSDQTQIERYAENNKLKTYEVEVPGRKSITIIETALSSKGPERQWIDIPLSPQEKEKDDIEIKNIMTDIIHDVNGERPRCYGPSCQDGFVEEQGPQADLEEYLLLDQNEKRKDYPEFTHDKLQAISALAEKLKNDDLKTDRYYGQDMPQPDDDRRVYTSWNKLNVKKHKHPYDDKDGWVSLEPVAWSTSKISKWKPNVKKHKPIQTWEDDDDTYQDDDRYNPYQGIGNTQSHIYTQSQIYNQKKPSIIRPTYSSNKIHVTSSLPIATSQWESESPSKPTWNKLHATYSYPATWNPDDGRRPHKPACEHDHDQNESNDDTVFYGLSDSVITDSRPSHFPYEYQALKRPIKRPTQVVYSDAPDMESDRTSNSFGDGQWVLLSTTKGYRNRKRQRSLAMDSGDKGDVPSVTSHQAVALTVLPVDSAHSNMTTSHGGLLEVERSFKTVEQSKEDMDKLNFMMSDSDSTPTKLTQTGALKKLIKRKIVSNASPDSSSVLAAVSAGMVPATMAMVLPMVLGRKKRGVSEYNHPSLYYQPVHDQHN